MPDSCPRMLFNVRASILTYSTSASTNGLVARPGLSAAAEFPLQTSACGLSRIFALKGVNPHSAWYI
jgi:hypothetical protein